MKVFSINEEDAHQRLDRFLKKILPNIPLSVLYKFNRIGKIKVNRKKQKENYILKPWDTVICYFTQEEETFFEKKSIQAFPGILSIPILYEDEDILVMNKPPGISVHPWDYNTETSNIVSYIHHYFQASSSLTFSPSLAHRLDKHTSWVLLIAKRKHALLSLLEDFKHSRIQKTYYAIVFWKMKEQQGVLTHHLVRTAQAKNENKVAVCETGKLAITHYTVERSFSLPTPTGNQFLQFLILHPKTGRMHQIRVQCACSWAWIVWDSAYGSKPWNKYFEKYFHISRQQLHASSITFMHPTTKQYISITAPLPDDMKHFLKMLSPYKE